MTTVEQDTRAEQVAGLHALADFLEANPELKSPFDGGGDRFLVYLSGGEAPEQLRLWAKATSHLRPTKRFDQYAGLTFDFFPGMEFFVYASREDVCERIVTGTETVTKSVKDPEALKAVPEVEVTEDVEIVEWRCTPLLAGDPS